MEPGNTHVPATCQAISDTLNQLGGKWAVYIVGELSHGPMRFNEIRRSIGGISQRMLTLTLRGLERDGLVIRTVYPTVPPRVDYELTELGHTLKVPLAALAAWAMEHQQTITEARRKFDAELAAEPVAVSALPVRHI